jgi:hypothetical protein
MGNHYHPRCASGRYLRLNLGIINNGYVINEVGRFVSKINESQYRLYNNISDTEKLASNYKMPEELTGKMRSYFISNDIASNKFNVE